MFQKISLIRFFSLITFAGIGQSPIDTIPPYQKYPAMPDFKILLTDSTWFKKANLPTTEYTAIIYFSPECGHCQHEAKEIVKNIDSLKQVFFVWASYRDLNDIKTFYYHYKLNEHPNNIVGRDPQYFIPAFFQAKYTPFVALYDQNKQFVKAWDMGVEIPELLEFFRKK
ncbi:MAG: hypothetical protein Q8K64_14965 [Sediminibacterium sp.]|nr:hypothetical protein [Sediminibacterium sp.]TXT28089.1 MAG: hypothetical protein FD136_2039 [Chitinophagaceae bacterium]